LINLRLKN